MAHRSAITESPFVRILLIGLAVLVLSLFLLLPLGAVFAEALRRGWQIFLRVTLPNIKWGLFYGVLLCNARAMGEFGAVSVVSGHIRGETNTLPLHIEVLYNEYQFSAAFACATLLALLALVTLGLKTLVEQVSSHSAGTKH